METNKERLTANNALIDQAQEMAEALPDAVAVDDTLTVSGAAADAKVTGEKFTALESEVAKIPKYKIVSELPTEGISASTVYLVADRTEERDKYSEFIFVVTENAPDDGFGRYDETAGTWEIFGSGTVDVDLSEIEGRIDELSGAIVDLENKTNDNSTGWTAGQIALLNQLFDCIPWTNAGAGAIADSLIASLTSTSSPDDAPDDEPEDNITQSGSVLTITALKTTPTQTGNVLTIA